MPRLSVRGFSCLELVDMEMGPVTILIGPQASGKSVISKLFYFFDDIFSELVNGIEEESSFRAFSKDVEKRFTQWFPPATWGGNPFLILYTAGPAELTIARKLSRNKVSDEIEFSANSYVKYLHDDIFLAFRKSSLSVRDDDENWLSISHEVMWPIARNTRRRLGNDLGIDYMLNKIFIPAGRSFYTNLGKAVVILEHGSHLDEITKRFGRMFTTLLGGRPSFVREKETQRVRDFIKHQKLAIEKIFGAEIKLARNDVHAATKDGRKIPFGLLSSGQQELLPLILILKYFTSLVANRREEKGGLYLFVEEPEAHLFPAAQGLLTRHLVETANFAEGKGRLLITTHSPYVLATMNNLIQAHLVGSTDTKRAAKVESVIPSIAWLSPKDLRAYAIEDGRLRSIKDHSGLIDASYLDQISNDINADFMDILEIESQA